MKLQEQRCMLNGMQGAKPASRLRLVIPLHQSISFANKEVKQDFIIFVKSRLPQDLRTLSFTKLCVMEFMSTSGDADLNSWGCLHVILTSYYRVISANHDPSFPRWIMPRAVMWFWFGFVMEVLQAQTKRKASKMELSALVSTHRYATPFMYAQSR